MNSKSTPVVSVIMGIYNCEKTVSEAIESILNQTYQDLELILCDDGSHDDTYEIALNYSHRYPDKVVLLRNARNMGLNFTLNRCLRAARGKYIARMDGDDKSLPDRIRVEVDFLEKHPEFALVSANLDFFDDDGVWGHTNFKTEPKQEDIAKGSPFSHSACIVRKNVFDEVGGYSEGKRLMRVEDKHLWYKIYAAGYTGYNLNQILYLYRDDRDNYRKRKLRYRFNSFYVSSMVIRTFRLPLFYYLYAIKPIMIGLLPQRLYCVLHKWNLEKNKKRLTGKGKSS